MRKILIASLALLASCATLSNPADPLITVLSRVANTAQIDLTTSIAVAQAATPQDGDGALCAQAALVVQGSISRVVAAAHVSGAGAFTVAELASLFQPGSAQYNYAKQTLVSGCAAKTQDVMGPAALLGTGVIGALAIGQQVLPLAAAVP